MIYGTIEGVYRSIISAGWAVKSGGDVEASTGHYAVLEIPAHPGERAEMREAVFGEDETEAAVFDSAASGWFFVVEGSSGNISYAVCNGEPDAMSLFNEAEVHYVTEEV